MMYMYNHQRKLRPQRSISFNIAYVRVCEWIKNPSSYPRPQSSDLKLAKNHANFLRDSFVLNKIQECEEYYKKTLVTPTPMLPVSTAKAEEIAKTVGKNKREKTLPYSLEFLTESERLDYELEKFLEEIEEIETRGL